MLIPQEKFYQVKAILFLSDFIDLPSLIISPNWMLQLLPMGIEKLGENKWDYCWLRGTR